MAVPPSPPGTGATLVVVCGLMASGKSTVARGLAGVLRAELLGADSLRADLLRGGARDAFTPGYSRRVYVELERRADALLGGGKRVILDGSFRTRSRRARARRLALRHGAPFRLVECRAGLEVCRARLREREVRDRRSSWLSMFEFFLRRWEPVREIPADEHVVVDTVGPRPDPEQLARRLGVEPVAPEPA